MQMVPRTISVTDAQVKYFYYSPLLDSAGGRGRFDVMEPATSSKMTGRYVAMTACRDNEKTVATARGSIFTLGLRQALDSAAMAGQSITPEELQHRTTRFIRAQIQSETLVFHPQIAGHTTLRQRPLRLVALNGGNGNTQQKLTALAEKSRDSVLIDLNKTCFEPGEVMELSIWISTAGYLYVVSSTADDRKTVLFPNQYHPHNAVVPGNLKIPSPHMEFELVSHAPPGPHLITAFLSRSPVNYDQNGFRGENGVVADLSQGSTRTLHMRRKQGWLAAGSVSVEVRESGGCR